jgi:hypothetical protein
MVICMATVLVMQLIEYLIERRLTSVALAAVTDAPLVQKDLETPLAAPLAEVPVGKTDVAASAHQRHHLQPQQQEAATAKAW